MLANTGHIAIAPLLDWRNTKEDKLGLGSLPLTEPVPPWEWRRLKKYGIEVKRGYIAGAKQLEIYEALG